MKNAWDNMWKSAGDMVDIMAKSSVDNTMDCQFFEWVRACLDDLLPFNKEGETFWKIWKDAGIGFAGGENDFNRFKMDFLELIEDDEKKA